MLWSQVHAWLTLELLGSISCNYIVTRVATNEARALLEVRHVRCSTMLQGSPAQGKCMVVERFVFGSQQPGTHSLLRLARLVHEEGNMPLILAVAKSLWIRPSKYNHIWL
jgi:hypothetical protein